MLGVIALQDTLRADAATAISELNALGVKGVILTGDNPRAAAAIAGELGLEFKAGIVRGVVTNRKSSISLPSGDTACARTPAGQGWRSLNESRGQYF